MDVESEGLPPNIGHEEVEIDLAERRRQFISQPSTVAARKQQAVCVRHACKNYGTKKNPNVVLDQLNMTVPKGTIYGLLGASGCGKTTLLSCIVGRRRLDSGEIWVLGGRPGSRGSGVPGPRVAYMPQELALYGEFTIRETLIFFGWVNGMKTEHIDARIDFLLKLLHLPHSSNFVKILSGGQQRRTSLAATLVHEPELLIMDEPTVGVDPVIRQNIWDHIVDITKHGHRTVIITTHYIEEARQAHIIGLMRGGKFLAEESPDFLLHKYNCPSLEDVFLKLAVIQNKGKRRRSSLVQEVSENIEIPAITNPALDLSDEVHHEMSGEFGDNISMSSRGCDVIKPAATAASPIPEEISPDRSILEELKVFNMNHMKTLLWKNFIWMWRNWGIMAFIIGLPMAQIILFSYAIGHDPVGLTVAVANNELTPELRSMQECPLSEGCNQTYLSCRFLEHLLDRKVDMRQYKTEEDALNAVSRGKAWLALVFPSNYSASLIERTEKGRSTENWTIDASDIFVTMDMSNQQISTLLMRDIYYTYINFVDSILVSCDVNPSVGKIPIRFNTPVYGDIEPNFTDFAAPGIILTIIFFLSVATTSGAMLIERNEGMLERYLVSGITGVELLFSHVSTQFLIMLGQAMLVLFFTFAVFGLTMRGPLVLVILLTIISGFCGMCFGFVVSCSCETERTATYMAMGSFLPIIMLCGIVWPVEGMYPGLKYVSYFLPLTYPTESLRSILQRGWDLSNGVVYLGFATLSVWSIIFLTISILLLKFKKG